MLCYNYPMLGQMRRRIFIWMEFALENIFLAVLQMAQGIGSARLRKLVAYFGSGENAWNASADDVRASGCLDSAALARLFALKDKGIDLDALAGEWEKEKIKLCAEQDDAYPGKLRHIYNPPALLFYKGTLSQPDRKIAVVGARKASPYGRNVALELGRDLTRAGVCVVSGGARGIDTAAHEGALKAGGTIAVLGCGVDVAYPAENRKLFDQIAESGLLLSEYAPGTSPNAKHFPARNRIISGLSDGVVVVEAAVKSGSLITAELALSEGRDVFAVPGSVFSESSKGCHKLIKQGAKLVDQAEDILEEYPWDRQSQNDLRNVSSPEDALSEQEAILYRALSFERPMTIDEIILKTRSDVSNITFLLLQMELRGWIAEHSPQCYIRAVKEGVL